MAARKTQQHSIAICRTLARRWRQLTRVNFPRAAFAVRSLNNFLACRRVARSRRRAKFQETAGSAFRRSEFDRPSRAEESKCPEIVSRIRAACKYIQMRCSAEESVHFKEHLHPLAAESETGSESFISSTRVTARTLQDQFSKTVEVTQVELRQRVCFPHSRSVRRLGQSSFRVTSPKRGDTLSSDVPPV